LSNRHLRSLTTTFEELHRSRRGNYIRNLAADHLEEIPSLQEISL
jgi:hypothetical protein